MDSCCHIEILGPLRVTQPQRTLTRFGTQKAGALLAFLALRAGRVTPREELTDLFWGDMDLSAGRDNLSTTLSTLRRLLEPPGVPRGGVLTADRAAVGLTTAVTTDVARFEGLLGQAREAGGRSDGPGLWGQAVGLYRGGFLPGCYLDWAVREGERLQGLYLGALDAWTRGLEASGEAGGAWEAARQWADADPFSEEAHGALIRLSVRAGRPDAARTAYRALERMLRDEYGTSPSPTVRGLMDGLVSRSDPAPPPVVPVSRQTPPPPPSLPAHGEARPAAPPASFSRFFGREAELALLGRLLPPAGGGAAPAEERARLVTVTGPGGMGKTRLALEFARAATERGGHWVGFVPLADVSAAGAVLTHVAQTLRLPDAPGTDPLDRLAAFFTGPGDAGRAPVLILDNLEQIPGAGDVVRALMERIPALACLGTSRRRLGLRGERLVPLTPLAVPDGEAAPPEGFPPDAPPATPAGLLAYPSVRLYVDRAQAVRPDFQITPGNADAVTGLCRALEGSPLALELAASWVRALPPRAMCARLSQGLDGDPDGDRGPLEARYDDLPDRHRSLWAALDWSYRLLTPPQQRLFARLSVFRGGWTRESCEAVGGEPDALAILADLEEASLIQSAEAGDGQVRWHMLGTVRRHAGGRLRSQGDGALTAARHLGFFLALAERAELGGRAQKQWLDTLEAEHDNLRAALDHGDDGPESLELRLRLAAALMPFWRARGHLLEGQRRTDALLALPDATGRSPARAAALNGAGVLAMLQSDYAGAEARHAEAYAIAQERSDPAAGAAAALGLGNASFYRQDYAGAKRLYEESLALRPPDDARGVASCLHSLGGVALREERYDDAAHCYERARGLRQGQGDTLAVAASLGGLGQVALLRQDYGEAARLAREALRIFADAGQQWTTALCLENISRIAEAQGRDARAALLLGAATALRGRSHFLVPPAERDGYEERLSDLRTRMGPTAFAAAWDAGLALPWEDAVADAQRA